MQYTLKISIFIFTVICLFGFAMEKNCGAEERNLKNNEIQNNKFSEEQNLKEPKITDQKSDRSNAERQDSDIGKEKPSEFIPLADQPELLKKLDRSDPIWVTSDRKEVLLGGTVCLREGLLEFFACREQSKEHESIISLKIKPHLIHAGLLVIGARQGAPARFDPEVIPPSGEEIEVAVRWLDEKGKRCQARAQEWVLENKSGKEMSSPWVFTGGLFGRDSKGKRYYLADISGEVFGVSNFPGSVLDVPFVSSSNNDELFYQPNTKKIPPVGTQVTLILKRTGKFHVPAGENSKSKGGL